MSKIEAKQFWIEQTLNEPADPVAPMFRYAYDEPGAPDRNEIHVIEYSAYEEQRKRSIARKHEIHRLRSELSRLK